MRSAMKRTASSPINLERAAPGDFSGIIFDCDGVLFDSKEANTAYYNHIRFAVQLPPMTEDEAKYSHMASTDEALERMIPDALREEALLARRQTRYRDTFMNMMRLSPHATSFLHRMKEQRVNMALCTNRSDSVHEVLKHFDLDAYFSPIMTITHASPKPDPQGLLEILRVWETGADRVVFLGDSFVDQQAAVAAGIPFWSFANPDLAAEMHIADFKEMDEIITLMLMR